MNEMLTFLIEQSPALIVALPLLGAFLTPLVSRVNATVRNAFVLIMLLLTGALVALLSYDVFIMGNIHAYVFGADTISPLPIVRILFTVDALSMFMAIICITVAFIGALYSWSYMKEYTGLDKYYTLLLLMTAGMLGMVLTGDMFNFFVFLEITSIASCALIAFWSSKGESIEAAFKYIVISAIGALFVLFAIALLYGQYNALNMATLASTMQSTMLDKIALVFLVGALTMKAGIVPMHMWLPDGYSRAPSSVTLVLIGTTLASFYGVIRVCFTVYGNQLTTVTSSFELFDTSYSIAMYMALAFILILLAVITMLVGVLMAIKQNDLKRLIAFAAVAEIGFMLLGLGIGMASLDPTTGQISLLQGLQGGVFHVLNDALDIGLMFLVAGVIYYATKELSLDRLGGLARNMKYTSIFFLVGLFAVAGMPPLNGFASKLLIYESAYQINPILSIIAVLSSIMLLAVFIKVFHSVFLGPAKPQFKNTREAPKTMLVAMGLITVLILFFGLFPDFIINTIVEPATNAITNPSGYINAVFSLVSGGV